MLLASENEKRESRIKQGDLETEHNCIHKRKEENDAGNDDIEKRDSIEENKQAWGEC